MFIPLIGLAIGLFIMFSTGQAFRAIFDILNATLVSSAAPPNIQTSTVTSALVLIGLTFLFEFVSYSIGITDSIAIP